jgi:hypothetical protein
MQNEAPKFPFYKTRFKDPAVVDFLIGYSSPGNPFMTKQFETFLAPKAFSTACDLFFLSHILDLHIYEPHRFGPTQCEYFEDTFASAQHALAAMPYSSGLPVRSVALHQQHCWRIAALIYFNTALRYSPSPSLLKSMTKRLIEALRDSDTSTAWYPSEDVLLWIYFMGYVGCTDLYVGSKDVFERRWFMEETRRVAKILGLKSCDEMGTKLRQMLFREVSHQESLQKLWLDFAYS